MASARTLMLCRILVLTLVLLSLCSCKRHRKKSDKKAQPVVSGSISSVTMQTPTDPAKAPLFGKVEWLVKFDATKFQATRFYDPDPAQGGVDLTATFVGPSGTFTVPGFYDGTKFLIRFSPTAVGAWSFSIAATDPGGPGAYKNGSFTCVTSTNPGFVLMDGSYLRRSHNNAIFFPVGHHMGWQDDVENPAFSGADGMTAHGENLLAFWQAVPWATTGNRVPVEGVATGGVGNYSQTPLTWLDGLVGRAETANVCLQPTIWSHGELRSDTSALPWGPGYWSKNGYSAICATPADFYVFSNAGADTPQWRYQKNFLRYLFARYGYSRAIANWVAVAEVNGTEGGASNPTQAIAWLQQVRAYWASLDVYRSRGGVQAPIAAFWTDSTAYDPGLDLRSVDTYTAQDNDVLIGAYTGGYTDILAGLAPPKPCFLGEFGGRLPPLGAASEPRHAHNGLWASVSAGACMTPLLWCDAGSWPLLTQPSGLPIRNHLQCLGTFMAGVDALNSPAVTSESVLSDFLNQRWGWSTHSNDRGFAWVYSFTTFTIIPVTATLTGLDDGTYSVQWYDVWTNATPTALGAPVNVTVASGTVTLFCPSSALSDVACKFVRTGAAAAPAPALSARTGAAVQVIEQAQPSEPGTPGEPVPPSPPLDVPPPQEPPPQEPPPNDPPCPDLSDLGEPVAPPIAPGDF